MGSHLDDPHLAAAILALRMAVDLEAEERMAELEDKVQQADTWVRAHRTVAALVAGMILGAIIVGVLWIGL